MKWLLAAFLVFCLAAMASAQSLPALYSVTDVAVDDVLNVRAEPSGSAAIVGSFAPNRSDIEVTARDMSGKWGRVNVNERSGWVSMRYLAALPMQEGRDLPRPMVCFGMEPFWLLSVRTSPAADFRSQDGTRISFSGLATGSAEGRTDRYMVISDAPDRALHGVVERRSCSDGMSDQNYGLDINLFLRTGRDTRLLTGCCSVAPR